MNSETENLKDGRGESPNERADRNWVDLMQELRVMQTGSQVLTGFLLAVAFQPRFAELTQAQITVYVLLVLLAAIATILSITPVVLHRMLFREGRKPRIVTFGSWIVSINLVTVTLLTIGVTTFIIEVAVSDIAALLAFGVALAATLGIWFVLGQLARRRRRKR